MKNYVGKGETLTVAAPANLASGEFVLIGAAIFGAAIKAAASGDPVALVTSGLFEGAPKATGAAWVVGDIVYWDATAKNFTKTSSANSRVGVAAVAAATGDAVGTVKLTGIVQ